MPTIALEVPTNYTLHGGEFPYCIARRFDVNPSELLRLNGLGTYSVYYSGMTLRIPHTGNTFPGQRALRPHPTTYSVRSGDTIYSVACIFGDVQPENIALANGLTPRSRAKVGNFTLVLRSRLVAFLMSGCVSKSLVGDNIPGLSRQAIGC